MGNGKTKKLICLVIRRIHMIKKFFSIFFYHFFCHFFRFLAAVRSTPPKIEKNAKFNFFVEQASQPSPLPTRQEKKCAKKKSRSDFFWASTVARHSSLGRIDRNLVQFLFVIFFRIFFVKFKKVGVGRSYINFLCGYKI